MKHLHQLIAALSICFLTNTATAQTNSTKTLIVFFDGLRTDYITPELMPSVYAFKQQGCYGNQHHSVFPTVTRVNASSYSTGSYPARHGLMGNTVYFPEVNKTHGLNTGDAGDLDKINQATHGHLLTAVSLGELLQAAGAKMMVFSSGSTGQAMMQNHTVSGGAVINPGMILPGTMKQTVTDAIGPAPPHAKPNTPQHIWVTDALLKYGVTAGGPAVSAIWFSDPDGTAHSDGIGSPTAIASIQSVDHEFGRILDSMKSRGLYNYYNIIISTDHGFVTHAGKESLANFLIKQGLKKDRESEDVVVAEGAVYVQDHNEELIRKIVAVLQSQEWIGAVFTKGKKPGDAKGWVNGTLSFESIHWDHPQRAADILVDENWNDNKNANGYAGTGFSGGVAGHGGLSPYEVHIPLVASGPGFKKKLESELPTSNVDIVPTILYLHGLAIPTGMDGRVMAELLVNPPKTAGARAEKKTAETTVTGQWGTYRLQLETTVLGKYKYVNFAKVIRTYATAKE